MHPLVDQCKTYICNKNLFDVKSKLLIAVSGGMDSVALVHVLTYLGYDIALAHCNFKLIHIQTFDTKAYAKGHRFSIEESARILRYTWFETLRKEFHYDFIVTGHHKNDVIETFFINLVAGSGINGLKSIPAKNNSIVRPFLFADRNTISDYCEHHGLEYRTDQSNFDTSIVRNKIRHQIIPLFQEINPGFIDTMSRNIDIYTEFDTIYRQYIETKLNGITYSASGLIFIDYEHILMQEAPISLLYEIIAPYGFNSTQTRALFSKLFHLQTGKVYHGPRHRIIKHGKQLIIGPKKQDIESFELREEQIGKGSVNGLRMICIENESVTDFSDQNSAFIDAEKLQFPLLVRPVATGDYFYPYGMKGRKTMSDYFTDLKLHTFEREKTPVLTSGNQIVWVIGHRIDERFKVDGSTRQVLQIIKN
jgi:tRNA(Ile)-lysidine synthase